MIVISNCRVCEEVVQDYSIKCHECTAVYHRKCVGMASPTFYNLVYRFWKCYNCSNKSEFRFMKPLNDEKPVQYRYKNTLLNPDLVIPKRLEEFALFNSISEIYHTQKFALLEQIVKIKTVYNNGSNSVVSATCISVKSSSFSDYVPSPDPLGISLTTSLPILVLIWDPGGTSSRLPFFVSSPRNTRGFKANCLP